MEISRQLVSARALGALLSIALLAGVAQSDKLDDLGLDRNGKPISQSIEAKQSLIQLPGKEGMQSLARPELNSVSGSSLQIQIETILSNVIAGPTTDEIKQGVFQVFPQGTQLSKINILDNNMVEVYLDFPKNVLNDTKYVANNFDWINLSLFKSIQELPIVGVKLLVRDDASNKYQALDKFLPPDTGSVINTEPDTASPVNPNHSDISIQQNVRLGGGRPVGALSGKAVYLNPGHGLVWRDSDYWGVQRTFIQNNIEDFSNVEMINQYLYAYCYNAGGDVFSVRELDPNPNMVIVDNDDGSPAYVETGTGWTTSTLKGFANGHSTYTSGQNPFSFGTNRLMQCTVGTPNATATYTPTIPADGWYFVYVSHAAYNNRSAQAHYKVFHTGGATDYYLDQRMRRFTWIPIGQYYFKAGNNPSIGKVVLYNDSASTDDYISADAVRFGGGMGLISRGASGVSGVSRRDEDARYNLQFAGSSEYDLSGSTDEADGWTYRPRFGRWLFNMSSTYGAPKQDSVYISSHTNAGGGTGMGTYVYTGYENTWNDTFRNYVHDEVYNDIHYGYTTSFKSRSKYYGTYGENNPDNVDDLMPIFLGEWLFHDSATDMSWYHDPKFRRALARAMYQGVVKFWANRNGTAINLLPEPPMYLRTFQESNSSIKLIWDAPPYNTGNNIYGDAATGYKVYMSTHGKGFSTGSTFSTATATLSNLSPGTTYYFYVTATNAGGESFPSDVLAVKLAKAANTPKVLIVNAFDKMDISTRLIDTYSGGTLYRQYNHKMNTYDYIVEHAKAIDNYSKSIAFDACEDDCIQLGYVTLSNYSAIIWIGGIQSEVSSIDPTNDISISAAQQTSLSSYLNAGGKLFISSAEVAWDLDRSGTNTFVDATLHANYVADASNTFTAYGKAGSIFEGLGAMNFDDETGKTYRVNWADVITPVNGSITALEYGSSATKTSLVDFDSASGWWDPNGSGSTNADALSTFGISASPVHEGSGAGNIYYVWGSGNFLREYNSTQNAFTMNASFSMWVYGDGSGHQIRVALKDSNDSELFVNPYTTLNFTGWQEITWNNINTNQGTKWAGTGDGVITGPNVKFDSIHINKVSSVASGHVYVDDATYTPVGGSNGQVAAVQYGNKLVYMGFPFETITSEANRNNVMAKALDYLLQGTTSVENFELYSVDEE